jgi:hypothetical protein
MIIAERSIPLCFIANLYSNGIIEVIWDESIAQVALDHMWMVRDAVKDLGKGKKMPMYAVTHGFLRLNKKAKLFAASAEGQKYTLANAVLVDNPGKRILFNFFMLLFKPITPTQPFANQKEAFTWILGVKNK